MAFWSGVLFLVLVAWVVYASIVVYRTSMVVVLAWAHDDFLHKHHTSVATWSASCINAFVVFCLNFAYDRVALWLTKLEWQRTQKDFDRSLNMKASIFRSLNSYSSIFYVAFAKTAFSYRSPNNYGRIFGFRLEECSAGGCHMELVKMVSVLFAAKQIKDTLLPFIWEYMAKVLKKRWKKRRSLYKKMIEVDPNRKEYLKYTIQFGFITLFASVFPLAPLLALFNNIVDLRLTARRFLTCYQRPVPQKVQNIGV